MTDHSEQDDALRQADDDAVEDERPDLPPSRPVRVVPARRHRPPGYGTYRVLIRGSNWYG